MKHKLASLIAAVTAAVAVPSAARACPFYEGSSVPCEDDFVVFEMPGPICTWSVLVDGENGPLMEPDFGPCDGSELVGGPATVDTLPGVGIEIAGLPIDGGASMQRHRTSRPLLYSENGRTLVIMRDWDGKPGPLDAWRREVRRGAAAAREVSLVVYDAGGKLAARYPVGECRAVTWNVQVGVGSSLLETTRLVCNADARRVIRRLQRSLGR